MPSSLSLGFQRDGIRSSNMGYMAWLAVSPLVYLSQKPRTWSLERYLSD